MPRLLPLLLLTACSDYALNRNTGSDVFTQTPSAAVDWLFVVDDSCSMAPHQERVGEHFDTLVAALLAAEVDLQMAVVTTDVGGDHGRIRDTVLTPDMPQAEVRFREAVQVGTSGSGFEMGLEASLMALSEPAISGANAGFLREGADLVVLYVSDEEDNSPRSVADHATGLREAVNRSSRTAVQAHALVVLDEATCAQPEFEGSEGTRYAAMAAELGGQAFDLCADDLGPSLEALSTQASGLTDLFPLGDRPVPSSLEVFLDDAPVVCGEDFVLEVVPDRAGKDLVGLRFSRMPPVGSRITAAYTVTHSLPEGPCE